MSTRRPSSPDRRAPHTHSNRRERLRSSTQRGSLGARPPLPRLGPEGPAGPIGPIGPVASDDPEHAAATPQTEHEPVASASRNGFWVGGILTRTSERREHPFWAGWLDAVSRVLPRRSPFSWRERDWRGSPWGRRARVVPAVAILLVALVVVGTFAITLATHAAGVAQNKLSTATGPSATAPAGNVLRPVPPSTTPTPAAPQYLVGAWVSSASGGSVQVFVRVTHGDAPAAHVPVTLSVDFPGYSSGFGPAVTDADGVASLTVTYGGLPQGEPVFINANATVGGQTVSAQTTFVTP